MKKVICYISMLLACAACTRDVQYEMAELRLTETVVVLTSTSVQLSLDFDELSKTLIDSVGAHCAAEDAPEDVISLYIKKDEGFTTILSGLTSDRQYIINYSIRPSYMQQKEFSSSFVTHCNALPEVITRATSDLLPISATLYGSVAKGVSDYKIIEYGFYYSLLKTGEYERHQVKCGEDSQGCDYSTNISMLRAGATYYYYAYAANINGIAYGDTLTFALPKTY